MVMIRVSVYYPTAARPQGEGTVPRSSLLAGAVLSWVKSPQGLYTEFVSDALNSRRKGMCEPKMERIEESYTRTLQNRLVTFFVVLTAVGVLGMLWARLLPGGPPAKGSLIVASTAFVAIAVVGGGLRSRYGYLMLAALVLCWLGDYAGPLNFLLGVTFFLFAHLAIIGACFVLGLHARRVAVAACFSVGLSAAVLAWLIPTIPVGERAHIVAYVIVITSMCFCVMGTRVSPSARLLRFGAICFYLSDFLLAITMYVKSGDIFTVVGYPLYYTSCVLFALSAVVYDRDVRKPLVLPM